jgi:hypothetical protein
MNKQSSYYEDAYEIAKLQASTDGAFDERLTRHWFAAAWETCASAIGMVPPGQITETVNVDGWGNIKLSGKPTSDVKLYANGALVAVLPPNAPQLDGHRNLDNPYAYNDINSIACMPPSLCCYCSLTAQYSVGHRTDPCGEFSPSFVQAVARLFAYMVENRGDVKIDDQILTNSGAKGFLAPNMTYIA